MTGAWHGRVFLGAGTILYVGPGAAADTHAHHAVQLVWAIDGTFELEVDGVTLLRSAVLVPANVEHALDSTDRVIALLLVESHGLQGRALDGTARQEPYRELATALATTPFPRIDLAAFDVVAWCDRLLRGLGVSHERSPIGSVTRRAIEFIEHNLDGVPTVTGAARHLSLSTTRLTHLFSREVGIPFRRFVLWTRIKRAVSVHRQGSDLTTSAIAAGFSDAAHFSRTFRAMFGLGPSLVLSTAEIVGDIWM